MPKFKYRCLLGTFTMITLATCLFMTGCSTVNANPATKPPFSDAELQNLTNYLEQHANQYHIPGTAFAVISHGKIVYSQEMGYANLQTKTRVTENTLFPIGSITKSVTAAAVLQLRDKGLLSLNDPVQKYLPWFNVGNSEQAKSITLYELLTQSSGISRNAATSVLAYTGAGTPSLEEGVRALSHEALDFAPGTSWEYSNMNYAILGLMVQDISGEPYTQYIESHVLRPLSMNSTAFDTTSTNKTEVSTGYILTAGSNTPTSVQPLDDSVQYADPAGSRLSSTISDMAKYISFQLGDGSQSVLSKASLNEAHTNGVMSPLGVYGYGWIEVPSVDSNPKVYYWHDGSVVGWMSLAILYPTVDSGVIILTNESGYPDDNSIVPAPDASKITSILFRQTKSQ